MSVILPPQPKSSRCFCDHTWIINTKWFCNSWIAEEPNIHILSCGHGFHEHCYHTLLRICRDVQKPFHCPECHPHWTRPRDLQRRLKKEIGSPIVKYAKCLCSGEEDCVDLRLEQNADGIWKHGVWTTKDESVELLSCGHIFHKNCWRSFQNTLNELKIKAMCPFCIKPVQDKVTNEGRLVELEHERYQIQLQFDAFKSEIATQKREAEKKQHAMEKHLKSQEYLKWKQHWMTIAKTFLLSFIVLNVLGCITTTKIHFSVIDKDLELQRFHLFLIAVVISGLSGLGGLSGPSGQSR